MSKSDFWRHIPGLATYALVVVALTGAILWMIPANYYLVFPGSAQQVSSMISVGGHEYRPTHGALFDTYVNELKASRLLYVVFGLLRPDVTVEPAADVSQGCPDPQYQEQLLEMMADSKLQAEAAALNAVGRKVQLQYWGPEIQQLSCGFPAASELQAGDRILAVDGVAITGLGSNGSPVPCPPPPPGTQSVAGCHLFKQIQQLTVSHPPGSVLHLTILRGGKRKDVAVKTVRANALGTIVHKGGHTMIGIVMSLPYKFPVAVHIDSGNVGGPSAGLAFTLGIIQQLEHRDLTNGNRVAVTGTISYEQVPIGHRKYVNEGIVGPIGGARQKALAAQAAGAKYFIVPTANYAEALSAHANLRVIPVNTVDEALRVLESLRAPRPSA
ncbi:MAG TPA: S16 family serine protease [Chloroflexota bacterium]|nr:S16 family serine protease [Chloroflexota bacterium]